ncbi:MAG: glycerol acyltransferase, partial [Pseudomonadota bacterium]
MEHRIDPLIAERAPWLYSDRPGTRIARRVLNRLLGYDTTVSIAKTLKDAPSAEIMATMGERLSHMVEARG